MGPVENEINDEIFENDENAGTAIYDFVNDWEVSQKSTPNTENSYKTCQGAAGLCCQENRTAPVIKSATSREV